MNLPILSGLHAEFETFEVPKALDYDVVVLAGGHHGAGRAAASWLRDPDRFSDNPRLSNAPAASPIAEMASTHTLAQGTYDPAYRQRRSEYTPVDSCVADLAFIGGNSTACYGVSLRYARR